MKQKLSVIIDKDFNNQVKDLQSIIRIPSISRGEPLPGMPFGQSVHDSLQEAFCICHSLGLTQTSCLDGKVGFVDFGEGKEQLAILSHLDVVPAGNGWSAPPFSGELKDGCIWGRGAHDDKGPAVSAIYALAAVKALGLPFRRRVRIIFGLDEEVGMEDISRYRETEEEPTLAFTPDGEYPVVNGEMNIGHITYHVDLENSGINAHIGTAANVIPDEASIYLSRGVYPSEIPEGYSVTYDKDTITVRGIGGHASMPEGTANALQGLFKILSDQPMPPLTYGALSALHAMFDFDMHGEGFGLDLTDSSGRLTLQPTILHADENGITITMDTRFPTSLSGDELLAKLDACFLACGYSRVSAHISLGHYIPENSELVSTLMEIYASATGSSASPMSIGGGTYARDFKNAVAFGPTREGAPNMCHVPDERVPVEDLRFNTRLMAEAIMRFACVLPQEN